MLIQDFEQISRTITQKVNELVTEELSKHYSSAKEMIESNGGITMDVTYPKFKMKFTIKPIKSNVKQKSRGEKSRTAQGSKESSPKKIGTKSRKAKFTRSSPNPLD